MKKIIFSISIVLILVVGYVFGSGFIKKSDVFIGEYFLSKDNSEITINVGVTSSRGYIRKVIINKEEKGRIYLDCYSPFGGINGQIGAKSTYKINLNKDTSIIALYDGHGYRDVLRKNENNKWERIK